MKDLSIKDFSDLVYEKLEPLKYKQILTNPTTTSKFPCLELHTPLKSVNLTENAFPIRSTFQISITCWNEKQRQAMQMTNEVDTKLQELNFIFLKLQMMLQHSYFMTTIKKKVYFEKMLYYS